MVWYGIRHIIAPTFTSYIKWYGIRILDVLENIISRAISITTFFKFPCISRFVFAQGDV